MRYLGTVFTAIFLTSCGSQGSGGSSSQPEAPQTKAAKEVDPDEYDSFLVKDEASLGECDASKFGRLAYIVKSKQFKACDEGGWQVVDIKGEKGDQGQTGETVTAPSNTWKDVGTGYTFMIGGLIIRSQVTCPSGWSVPSNAVALAAKINGLPAAHYWSQDLQDGRYAYVSTTGYPTIAATTSTTETHYLVCYK